MRRQLIEALVVRVRRIVDAHRDDLVVAALVVDHPQPADRARVDDRERLDRLLHQHEDVERVVVLAVGARDEPVVRRVVDGAVQHAIEPQQAGRLVDLVLEVRAARNLDHRRQPRREVGGKLDVVDRMHPRRLQRTRRELAARGRDIAATRVAAVARQPERGAILGLAIGARERSLPATRCTR